MLAMDRVMCSQSRRIWAVMETKGVPLLEQKGVPLLERKEVPLLG